jgi:hypothetical protein
MNYQTTEASIVTRLAPMVVAGYAVAALPDVQADFINPIGPQVWVAYQKSKFDQTNDDPKHLSMGSTHQKEVLNFELTIQSKKLRGNNGVYKTLELVRLLLVGFRPTNCHKLYMVEVSPVQYEENLWTYKMLMACQSVVIEQPDTEEEVLITKLTLDSGTPEYDEDPLNENIVIQP